MDAETKLVKQRLLVLELVQEQDDVSEACRRRWLSRHNFYEYRRRSQTHGLEGLKDLRPIAHSHPQMTPQEVRDRIAELVWEHSEYGCNRLDALLKAERHVVFSATIQKVLNEREFGSRFERLARPGTPSRRGRRHRADGAADCIRGKGEPVLSRALRRVKPPR